MAKHRCGIGGCTRPVKKQGDPCWQHKGLEDQIKAGAVHGTEQQAQETPAGAREPSSGRVIEIDEKSICAVCVGDCNAGPTPCQPGNLSDCVNFASWRRDDERTMAMLALVGCAAPLDLLAQQSDRDVMAAEFYAGALHLQASDNEDVQVPPMPAFLGSARELALPAVETGHLAARDKATDAPDPAATPTPPHEVEHLAAPRSALSRLLRKLEPVAIPLPPTSILLEFSEQEFEAIKACEVPNEDLKELIMMLVRGELGQIVEADDPLAKSRRREAQ